MDIRFLHRRVVLIQQNNHSSAVIPRQIHTHIIECRCGLRIAHMQIDLVVCFLLISAQQIPIQKIPVFFIYSRNLLFDLDFRFRKLICFHGCKTQKDHRICSLKFPIFSFFPNAKSFKQIAPDGIFIREKAVQHAHIQCLAKAAGAGDQGDFIPVFPPVLDEVRFIHKEIMVFP